MYIEILTLSIIIDIDRQHWKSCTAVATSEWHTVKICKHSHNRLIDNIGDYLYFKNQRMEASNLKLIHISSTWDCTTFHNFLPMFQKKKKDFQKLAGLWLADEVVNHVGIYGSKAVEGLSAFQRRSCNFSDYNSWCQPVTMSNKILPSSIYQLNQFASWRMKLSQFYLIFWMFILKIMLNFDREIFRFIYNVLERDTMYTIILTLKSVTSI